LDPVHVEHELGDRRSERRRNHHPDGRKGHRRAEHVAEGCEPGAQAPVEQNQRERHRPHDVRAADVGEHDHARSGLAGEHAHEQEHEQERRAEAHGDEARQDAGEHQQRAEQNAEADRVEGAHRDSFPAPQCTASPAMTIARYASGPAYLPAVCGNIALTILNFETSTVPSMCGKIAASRRSFSTPKSSIMPLPPCSSTAWWATFRISCEAKSFAMLQSASASGALASTASAARAVSAPVASILAAISASRTATAWGWIRRRPPRT